MWGALVSEKICMVRRKDGILITSEHGQLTDGQAEDLFSVVDFMYRRKKRLADIFKKEDLECLKTTENQSNA